MNAMADLSGQADESGQAASVPPTLHTLRRTGRKPVKFSGWRMVESAGAGDGGAMWYDLTLYRSQTAQVIVELIARRSQLGEQDLSRVEIFESLDHAVAWLEAYDCANDVPVPAELMNGAAPMAATVLYSVQLRQRIMRIADEFHGLLSDIFGVLGVADAVHEPVAEPA